MKIEVGASYEQVEEIVNAPFELMDDGDYDLQVKEVVESTSQKGNEMLVWTFAVINNPEFNGREFRLWTILPKDSSEDETKRCFSFFGTIKAMGWEGGEVDTDSYVGKECKGLIAMDKFINADGEEKDTNKLKKVFN